MDEYEGRARRGNGVGFAVGQDTPRLVVMFHRNPDGSEHFQWGIVGSMPILTLIGAVGRVQIELEAVKLESPCSQLALVIAWDDVECEVHYFTHPDIPTDPLCGMLETIKAALVGTRVAQQRAAQLILGPDGVPVKR
jgi:hypothetical protein